MTDPVTKATACLLTLESSCRDMGTHLWANDLMLGLQGCVQVTGTAGPQKVGSAPLPPAPGEGSAARRHPPHLPVRLKQVLHSPRGQRPCPGEPHTEQGSTGGGGPEKPAPRSGSHPCWRVLPSQLVLGLLGREAGVCTWSRQPCVSSRAELDRDTWATLGCHWCVYPQPMPSSFCPCQQSKALRRGCCGQTQCQQDAPLGPQSLYALSERWHQLALGMALGTGAEGRWHCGLPWPSA